MAYQLKAHVETGHPDYKPFSCEILVFGLSFKNRETLRKHRSMHTKPHCCEKCGQRFGQRVRLKTNMYEHTDNNLRALIIYLAAIVENFSKLQVR